MPRTTDPKTLEKIRRLLALAADPGASEEEARTASFQAARLMREHGVTLGEAAPTAAAGAAPASPAGVSVRGVDLRMVLTAGRDGLKDVSDVIGVDVMGLVREGLENALRGFLAAAAPPPPPAPAKRARRRVRARKRS